MRLGVNDVLLEVTHRHPLFHRVGFAQHFLVEIDLALVVVPAVIVEEDRVRQVFGDIEGRVDDALAVRLHRDVEIAGAHGLDPRAGRHDLLRHLNADLAPFIDGKRTDVFVWLVDITVEHLEAEVFGPGLFQQALGLRARFFDVRPEPGELLQLLFGRGER